MRKVQSNKDRCALCSREVRKTTITHEETRGTDFYLFQNVPALVCSGCGEIWIEESTLQEIDRLIDAGTTTRKVERPVYDFSLVAAR
jgi:YgiT-type zinc finger domain-containing protein